MTPKTSEITDVTYSWKPQSVKPAGGFTNQTQPQCAERLKKESVGEEHETTEMLHGFMWNPPKEKKTFTGFPVQLRSVTDSVRAAQMDASWDEIHTFDVVLYVG